MEPRLSSADFDTCHKEINRLLIKGAIKAVSFLQDQFLSPYFLVDKPSGGKRFILNLKSLNNYIVCEHFKMEDLKTVSYLVSPGCFMASIDLEEAYFLVPIHPLSKKLLRFSFDNQIYEFQVLPFGLATAPLVFTKIMKPIVSYLREKGFLSVIYLDDFLLLGDTFSDCQRNVNETITFLEDLGFILNFKKSSLNPSQELRYLGFIINSLDMSIILPEVKRLSLLNRVKRFSFLKKCKLRDFASLIGSLISACRAVPYGFLYTRGFERENYLACLDSENNYNAKISLPRRLQEDFLWWISILSKAKISKSSAQFTPSCEIFTDASLSGWGAAMGTQKTHGWWSVSEQSEHINYLELKAVYYALRCFAKNFHSQDVLLRIDKTTAIAYINKMGSVQIPKLAELAKSIWQWAEERELYLFASYISSSDNFVADSESRIISTETEWELSDNTYLKITKVFGIPDIDLLATNTNTKCETFISWFPDPFALAVDAFTVCWSHFNFYVFPPFALIARVLRKIITDRAKGIVVVPWWPTQPWYPLFNKLCISDILHFEPHPDLLSCPFSADHPNWRSIPLAAGILSGRQSSGEELLL